MEEKTNVTLTVEEIYKNLCRECKEKLLTMTAQAVTSESVKEQIRKQLEGKEG